MRIRTHLLARFELVVIAGFAAVVLLISTISNPILSIKSGFALTAVLLVLLSRHFTNIDVHIDKKHLLKISSIIVLMYIFSSFFFGQNFQIFLGILMLLSTGAVFYLIGKPSINGILILSSLLVCTILTHNFVNTGIYIGNVDPLWQHYPNIKNVIETGRLSSISIRYQPFPLTYILVAKIGIILKLSAYNSSIPLLVATSLAFVILSYLFTRKFVDAQTAKYAPLFVPGLVLINQYLSILFPQLIATLFLLLLFVTALIPREVRTGLIMLLSVALVFTHHFTIVIAVVLSPLILMMRRSRYLSVLAITGLIVLAQWAYIGEIFILELIFAATETLSNLFGTTPTDSVSVLGFGVYLLDETVRTAFMYLVSLQGIYFAALGSVLICAAYSSIKTKSNYGILLSGSLCALLIFPTPLSGVRGIARIGFLACFILIPTLCLGIQYLLGDTEHSNTLTILLVILVCTFGPAIAIGYTPINDAGINHKNQLSLSNQRVSELNQVAEFSQRTQRPVSSFWVTSLYLSYAGGDSTQNLSPTDNGILIPKGMFVYRTDWERFRATVYQPVGGVVALFSKEYIDRQVALGNNVYNSGNIQIVWYRDSHTIKSN